MIGCSRLSGRVRHGGLVMKIMSPPASRCISVLVRASFGKIVGADEQMCPARSQMPREHALADAGLDESGLRSKDGSKG